MSLIRLLAGLALCLSALIACGWSFWLLVTGRWLSAVLMLAAAHALAHAAKSMEPRP